MPPSPFLLYHCFLEFNNSIPQRFSSRRDHVPGFARIFAQFSKNLNLSLSRLFDGKQARAPSTISLSLSLSLDHEGISPQ